MLVYTNYGKRDFAADPVECKRRGAWEFWALLQGNITMTLGEDAGITRNTPTLWAFPRSFPFGCTGIGFSERAIFDFSAVPSEMETYLETNPYYEQPLSPEDCQRIQKLAKTGLETVQKPTQFVVLRQNLILQELSLIALRSIELRSPRGREHARHKVDQVLGWFESRIDENPTLEQAARFVNVSVAHLRRLFHEAYQESPKQAFTRVRKERIEHLLCESDLTIDEISAEVGFASASSLNHFIQKHFGRAPKELRQYLQHRQAGYI